MLAREGPTNRTKESTHAANRIRQEKEDGEMNGILSNLIRATHQSVLRDGFMDHIDREPRTWNSNQTIPKQTIHWMILTGSVFHRNNNPQECWWTGSCSALERWRTVRHPRRRGAYRANSPSSPSEPLTLRHTGNTRRLSTRRRTRKDDNEEEQEDDDDDATQHGNTTQHRNWTLPSLRDDPRPNRISSNLWLCS